MWERERVSETEVKTLQYRVDGPEHAPVLILGPALGTTWHMWDRQVPELSRHWRVLRYDLPGHGGAPAHPATSVGDLAARLLATADAAGADRFAYAGCSLGGAVGARIALDAPGRLTSLALISSAPRYATPDTWRQRGVVVRTNGLDPIARSTPERWFTPAFAAAQPAIVEWAVQMVRTTDPGCYIAACEALVSFDIRQELARIGVPTLVVAGAEDRVTPPADARALVAGIPDARLALVPDACHMAPVERPGEVTELLTGHFSAALPAGRGDALAAVPVPAQAPAAGTGRAPDTLPAGAAVAALTAGEQHRHHPGAAYDTGLRLRRDVLGDAHVDRVAEETDDFTGDFQDLLTRYAWGEVWARTGIDRRTRSVVTLTALTAGGHLEELASHTRAALRNGLTPQEIKEVLLHTAVYCGMPAAGAAFAVARRVIAEETAPRD
ncbi:bifunctional 3-oxoadipate enol-lactonase/4-carboxymuconolactone decarboxylase PcaDC [Streptomyces radiopugnans]|uniref:bifunctional 3-oxoadipate enol-lactonase/4-carboxymuconolactone decarboxylase PcaDC n=1 Tax=Streptomyces radiopugnans TaxID=403935 RepID=UPI003F1C51BC